MTLKAFWILVLSFLIYTSSFAQTKSQNVLAAEFGTGEFSVYKHQGYGIFMQEGSANIDVELNNKKLATIIKIEGTNYEAWGKSDSDWSSGFSYLNNNYCLWINDEATSMVQYKLDARSNTVAEISAYIGEKPGKYKAVKKMINSYLEKGIQSMDDDKDAVAQVKQDHRDTYSIANKEVTKLKLEIISNDKKLDCGSVFQIGIIATTGNGEEIKSFNLNGDFYPEDYSINVIGADYVQVKTNGGKNITREYTIEPFCEAFNDKQLVVEVTAIGKNRIKEIFRSEVNCVPDPAIIAAKEEAERRTKEREAYLAEEARRQKEQENQQSSGGSNTSRDVAANTEGKVQAFTVSKDYVLQPNGQLEVNGGYVLDGSYTLVGALKNRQEKFPSAFLSYNLEAGEDMAYKNNNSRLYGASNANAGDACGNDNMLLAVDGALMKTDKSGNVLNSFADPHLYFTAVKDLGNGTCVALASSPSSKKYLNRFIYRYKLHLIFWKYNENEKAQNILLSTQYVSFKPQLLTTNDGNVIVAFDKFKEPRKNGIEDSHYISFKSAETSIYKVDVAKTMLTNKLNTLWSKQPSELNDAELTDMIVARNGDIVFVLKGKPDFHEAGPEISEISRNINSTIYLASLQNDGTGFKFHSYNYIGANKAYGGCSKPKHSEFIFMGAVGRPFLFQNPKGTGYVVVHRPSLDVVTDPDGVYEEHFQDVPCFITHNAESLQPEVLNFLNVFRSEKAYQKCRTYSTEPYVGELFEIKDIAFEPNSNRVILVEEFLATNDEADTYSRTQGYEGKVGDVFVWVLDYYVGSVESRGDDIASAVEGSPDSGTSNTTNDRNNTNSSNIVTVENRTGRDIYYVEESSRNVTRINVNSSDDLDCTETYWYTFDANDGINGGHSDHPVLYRANSNCGNKIVIK